MARGRSRAVKQILGARGRKKVGRQEGAFNRSVTANRKAAQAEGIFEAKGKRQAGVSFMRGRRRFMWTNLTSDKNSRLIAVNDS